MADALAGKLSGAAKEHLLKDQIAWVENRAKTCTGDTEDVVRCLGYRYNSRIATLTGWFGSSLTSGTPRLIDAGTARDEGIWTVIGMFLMVRFLRQPQGEVA